MTINTASAVACVATLALSVETQLGINGSTARVDLVAAVAAAAADQGPAKRGEFATFTTLPSLPRGGSSEALAVNSAGTVVVGYSWGSDDLLYGTAAPTMLNTRPRRIFGAMSLLTFAAEFTADCVPKRE